jgi:hypothetical protein
VDVFLAAFVAISCSCHGCVLWRAGELSISIFMHGMLGEGGGGGIAAGAGGGVAVELLLPHGSQEER